MAQPQSELLSGLGKWFEINKRLVEQVINHGGNDSDVRKILSNPELAADFAKRLVGRIWDWVDVPVALDVNWKASDSELAEQYEKLGIAELIEDYYDDTELQCPPQYTLRHFQRTVFADEVTADLDCRVAGYRALLAYADKIDTGPCKIVALGSQTDEGVLDQARFPCLLRGKDARTSSVEWILGSMFDPKWFFLVYVTE